MIEALVGQIQARFAELSQAMTDPEVIGDRRRFADVGREYRALEPAHELAQQWLRARDDEAGAQELMAEDGDGPGGDAAHHHAFEHGLAADRRVALSPELAGPVARSVALDDVDGGRWYGGHAVGQRLRLGHGRLAVGA